jgi:hypothetical protein
MAVAVTQPAFAVTVDLVRSENFGGCGFETFSKYYVWIV